jgi:hypothetical protein
MITKILIAQGVLVALTVICFAKQLDSYQFEYFFAGCAFVACFYGMYLFLI